MRWTSALVLAWSTCASAPPCPPLRSAPTAAILTDFTDCTRLGGKVLPSLVRYRAWSADGARHPDRTISGANTFLCNPSAVARGPRGEIFVLNHLPRLDWRHSGEMPRSSPYWTSWVTVYDSAAAGDAAPLRTLRIYTRGLGYPTNIAVDKDGNLYVTSEVTYQQDVGSVAVFDRRANGNIAPLRVLAGPTTGLRYPQGLAVDRQGYLYVFNAPRVELVDTVLVFAPGAAGDTGPCRILGSEPTGIANPEAVAVDRRSRVYVTGMGDRNSFRVFDGTVSLAAPLRRIVGSSDWMLDGMHHPQRLAVGEGDSLYVRSIRNLSVFAPSDTLGPSRTFFYNAPERFALGRGDTLYEWLGDTVKVFPPGYTGAEAAVRTLKVRGTGPRGSSGMAVDRRGWLYLLDSGSSSILAYAPGASGDVPPARTISGWQTRITGPTAIAVDAKDQLYVTNGPRTEQGGAIRVYAPGARGEDQPVRILRGPGTGLQRPAAIAFGRKGEMYVSQAAGDSSGLVATFRRIAAGDEAPVARLTGPQTGLRGPTVVAFGPGDTMYVYNPRARHSCHRISDSRPSMVTVYPPGARGNVAPLRTLSVAGGNGDERFMHGFTEHALAVDSAGRVLVWHAGGAFVYGAGAEEAVPPLHGISWDAQAETTLTAVDIGRDGWAYETRVPRRSRGCF